MLNSVYSIESKIGGIYSVYLSTYIVSIYSFYYSVCTFRCC